MYFLFIVSAFGEVQNFSDINELNNSLKLFLVGNDSILSVEDELYKFFNNIHITILLDSYKENYLKIQFSDIKNNILPECLGRLINVETLLLMNNGLSELPEFFAKFTSLCRLDLSSNNFNKLPEVLFSLKSLTNLYLNRNKFESIEDNIERLKQLQALNFSSNNIIYVSNNLKKLNNLIILNLSNNVNIIRTYENDMDIKKDINFLKKIPESIESLYVNNIRLRYITCDLKLLVKLLILNIKKNFIKDLWCYCGKCIFIWANGPSYIHTLTNLKELELNENEIKGSFFIPKDMLSGLEKLDLTLCNIEEFEVEGYNIMNNSNGESIQYRNPYTINGYKPSNSASDKNNSKPRIIYSLQNLSITITKTYIVPNLLIFPNLRYLRIVNREKEYLRITPNISRSLFNGLSKMKFLKHLKLCRFNLVNVPKPIYNLKSLEYLLLSRCELCGIQDKIENLFNLTQLSLSYNNIRNINPKIFTFQTLITIVLTENPLDYLPSNINNDNSSFTLTILAYNIALFKQDDNNLGIMDISYKKVHQINVYGLCDMPPMSIEDLYKRSHNGEYKWELNQMLKIKIKEVEESQDDYNIIINYWKILEKYITDKDIKYKFSNYFKLLYGIKKRREEEVNPDFIETTKNYMEAIFKILTNLINTGNTNMIEPTIIIMEIVLSKCVIDQIHYFSYSYHLLLIDENESTNIESFIYNKIALLKYHALREVLTNNNEKQNINKFSNWQNRLSETLGLPLIPQKYGIHTNNIFLKCREYIIYQFFKLINVESVVKYLYGYINANHKIKMTGYRYIFDKNNNTSILQEYIDYEGHTGITEKGIYFILEEMGLIKKL